MQWDHTILIGRKIDECQFAVPDSAGTSRRHAELQPTETGWMLKDLCATNGTRVNGVHLEPGIAAELRAGDRFSLGKELFEVQIAERK